MFASVPVVSSPVWNNSRRRTAVVTNHVSVAGCPTIWYDIQCRKNGQAAVKQKPSILVRTTTKSGIKSSRDGTPSATWLSFCRFLHCWSRWWNKTDRFCLHFEFSNNIFSIDTLLVKFLFDCTWTDAEYATWLNKCDHLESMTWYISWCQNFI